MYIYFFSFFLVNSPLFACNAFSNYKKDFDSMVNRLKSYHAGSYFNKDYQNKDELLRDITDLFNDKSKKFLDLAENQIEEIFFFHDNIDSLVLHFKVESNKYFAFYVSGWKELTTHPKQTKCTYIYKKLPPTTEVENENLTEQEWEILLARFHNFPSWFIEQLQQKY